jgi:hypothetical protein
MGGNVGIGTTIPFTIADINLSVNGAGSSAVQLGVGGTRTGQLYASSTEIRLSTVTNIPLRFYTNDSESMRITGGGNVGVGTTSPSYLLHVNGGDIGTSGFFHARYNSSNETYKGTFNWAHLQLGNNGQNDIVAGRTATGGYFRFIVNNTNDWSYGTINGTIAMTIQADGNVGVGTTSPSYLLDVAGTSRSDLHIFRSNQSAPTADAFIFRPADNTVAFGTANTERMRITSAGSIGLGTTSPAGKFEIKSSAQNYTTSPAITFTDNAGVADSRWILGNIATTYGAFNLAVAESATSTTYTPIITILSGSNYVGIGTTLPQSKLTIVDNNPPTSENVVTIKGTGQYGVSIHMSGSSNYRIISTGASSNPGGSVFGVYDDASSAYAFAIKGSKLFNFNSTTFRSWGGSATALQVAGYGVIYNDGNNNLLIANNSYYNGSNNIYSNNGYATRYYQELSGGNHYFQVASSGTAGGTVTYNTALYIDSSKAVSVNTTTTSWASGGTTYSPLFNVDGGVSNTAYFNNTSAGSANVTIASLNYFISLDSGSVRVADFRVSGNSLNITAANHILLNPSSNVGIGTTSPVARLDVAGNATLVANFNYASNGTYVRWQNNGTTFGDIGSGASLVSGGSTNDFTIHARSTYNLTFATNFTERARINEYNQLLINATGSTYGSLLYGYNLGVRGNTSQAFISIAKSNQTLDDQGLIVGLDSSYAYFQVRDNIGIQFGTNNSAKVTVSSGGSVGIGTISPATLLDVRGEVSVAYNATYGLRFYNDARNNWSFIGNSISGSSSANLRFGDATGEVIRITGGSVGIGTINPGGILEARAGSGANFRVRNNGSNNLLLQNYNAADGYRNFQIAASTIQFFATSQGAGGANEVARFNEDGNLGIGTTSPSYQLHISRSASGNPLFVEGGSSGWVIFKRSGKSLYLNANYSDLNQTAQITPASGDYMGLSLSSRETEEDLYITGSTGFVGIGTKTPASNLHIYRAGQPPVSDGLYANVILDTDSTTNFQRIRYDVGSTPYWGLTRIGTSNNFAISGRIGSTWSDAVFVIQQSSGYVGINTTSPASLLQLVGSGTSDQGLFVTTTGTGNDYYAIKVGTGTSTDVFAVTNAGRVGIGLTNPNRTLTVNGILGINNGTANTQQLVLSADGSGTYISSTYIGSSSYVPLWLEAGGSPRIAIATNGNVGIGTTSPSTKLHVVGTSTFTDEAYFTDKLGVGTVSLTYKAEVAGAIGNYWNGTAFTGTPLALAISNTQVGGYDPVLLYRQTDSGGTTKLAGGIGLVGTGAWTAGNNANQVSDMYFLVRNASGGISERMRIKSDGNVGIGTTSPLQKLDVRGGILMNQDAALRAGTSLNWIIGQDSADNRIHLGSTGVANNIDFDSSSGTLVRIASGGNVGIGTTNPVAKLEVVGGTTNVNGYADGTIQVIGLSPIAFVAPSNLNPSLNRWGFIVREVNEGDFSIYDYRNSVTRLLINSSGNVGVGTTTPKAKLQVRGAISSEKKYDGREDGLVLYYPFSENTGTTTVDRSQTGMIGTLTNGPSWSDGIFGYSLALDGSNDYVSVAAPDSSVSFGTAMTYAMWIYPTNAGVQRNYLFDPRGDGSTGGMNSYFLFDRANSSTITFTVGNSNLEVISGNVTMGTNQWYHVAATRSGNTWRVYLNGVQVTSGTTNTTALTLSNSFRIGTYSGAGAGPEYYFKGNIDEARMYNRTLSANELMTLYLEGVGTTAPYTNASGNVGIGTTSPTNKLHLYDANRVDILFHREGYGKHYIRKDGDYLRIRGNDDSTVIAEFLDNSNNNTVNFPNGNVGIGTTNPLSRLHVVHTNYSEDPYCGIIVKNTSTSGPAYTGINLDSYYQSHVRFSLNGSLKWQWRVGGGNGTDRMDLYSWTAGSDVMSILNNGNVGIGSTSPAYKLDIAGTIRATGDVIAYSDARVKDNVQTIEAPLDLVTKLRGVTYTRKDSEDKSRKVGVIAQEVLPILPEVVQKDTNGNYSVAYGNIVGVLIEAIKELKAEIDILKNK